MAKTTTTAAAMAKTTATTAMAKTTTVTATSLHAN